jgi:hypothetical protein
MKPIFPLDKANHFIVGYLIYFIGFIFIGTWYALLPVVVAGFAKEIYDILKRKQKINYNNFDLPDFLYTIAGAVPSLIIKLI